MIDLIRFPSDNDFKKSLLILLTSARNFVGISTPFVIVFDHFFCLGDRVLPVKPAAFHLSQRRVNGSTDVIRIVFCEFKEEISAKFFVKTMERFHLSVSHIAPHIVRTGPVSICGSFT